MSESYSYGQNEGVGTLTLTRPEIHNAFDDQLIGELFDKLKELSQDSSLRILVLTGEGKSFSSGADLNWMKRMKDYSYEENLQDAYELADLMEALFSFPRPTIARVQGHAFGGGVGLMAACDFTVAVERAKFGFTEARLGLAPACISRPSVFRLGSQKARQLFLTAQVFTASEGEQWGLVDYLVKDVDELDEKVESLTEDLLQCSPQAQQACKELTAEIDGLDAKGARQLGAETIAELRVSQEGQEGIAAFLEKRKPQWQK